MEPGENQDEVYSAIRAGAQVQLPNINTSFWQTRCDRETVLLGFEHIHGITKENAEAIVKERSENGPYSDLYDFLFRVSPACLVWGRGVNLIKCGSFDNTGYAREQLLAEFSSKVLQAAQQYAAERAQLALIQDDAIEHQGRKKRPYSLGSPYENVLSHEERIGMERESLDRLPHELVFDAFHDLLNDIPLTRLADFRERKWNSQKHRFVGIVQGINSTEISRGANRKKLFIRFFLIDEGGVAPGYFVMGKRDFKQSGIVDGKLVQLKGDIKIENGEPRIVAKRIALAREETLTPDILTVKVKANQITFWNMANLKTALETNEGIDKVYLQYEIADGSLFSAQLPFRVEARSPVLLSTVHEIFDNPQISITK